MGNVGIVRIGVEYDDKEGKKFAFGSPRWIEIGGFRIDSEAILGVSSNHGPNEFASVTVTFAARLEEVPAYEEEKTGNA